MKMRKHLFSILIALPLSISALAQDILTPSEHSNKWVEGNEIYLKTLDSVKLKLNYVEQDFQLWDFEFECFNLSTTRDILIDPSTMQYAVTQYQDSNICDFTLLEGEILNASITFNKRLLKKNTIEPQKSVYGHIYLKRCKYAKEITLTIPIENAIFKIVFDKK